MARLRRRNVVTKSARGWSGSATWTETALGLSAHAGSHFLPQIKSGR